MGYKYKEPTIRELNNEELVVKCPQCKKKFNLTWDESDFVNTVIVRSCPSGGIYDVSIECPHCDYEEPL